MANERFQYLFPKQVLEHVEQYCPHYKDIIKIMIGDGIKANLGLREEDLITLKKEVNIIFHTAASTSFAAPLYDATLQNVYCITELLNIASSMARLKAFLHVSTAFVNFDERNVLEEKIYETSITPEQLLTLVKQLDKNMVSAIEPMLLGSYPNTYVFTKTVAEVVCQKYFTTLPLVIFRPALVLCADKDPIPGWINSLHGAPSLFAALTQGALKTMLIDKNSKTNVVPCDYVINGIIVSACVGIKNNVSDDDWLKEQQGRVYNFGSSSSGCTWKTFLRQFEMEANKLGTKKAFGIFPLKLCRNRFLYRLFVIVFHFVPAFLLDNIAKLFGKQTRTLQQYRKINKVIDVSSCFALKDWHIKNTNTEKLYESLSDCDKEIFFFDLNQLDWHLYIKHFALGTRLYLLKDSLKSLQMANKRLHFVYRLFWFTFTFGLFWIVYTVINSLCNQ